jgi:hypothetical protein
MSKKQFATADADTIQRALAVWLESLESLAAELGTVKRINAANAVLETMLFLRDIKAKRDLWDWESPLGHAYDILLEKHPVLLAFEAWTALEQEKHPRAVEQKMVGAAAIDNYLLCGFSLKSALEKVVGRDPKAVQELKDFRENLMRGTRKGADFYLRLKKRWAHLPPESRARGYTGLYIAMNRIAKRKKP